jgi:hypothetical protein
MENNGEYRGPLENPGEDITLKNQEVHAGSRFFVYQVSLRIPPSASLLVLP